MFYGDCAGYMDMTHCHTILIHDDDGDFLENGLFPEYNDNVPTRGNMDFTFSVSKGEAGTLPLVQTPSSEQGLRPERGNVPAAYPATEVAYNATAPLQDYHGTDAGSTASLLAKIKMRRSAAAKENRPPTDVEFPMSQTRAGQNASKEFDTMHITAQSDDMDITSGLTFAIDENVFPTISPTPRSQRPRLSFKTNASTTCGEFDMDMTRSQTVAINADMDMTRSQMVAINTEKVCPHPVKNRKSLAFVTPSNTTCGEFDMDLTRSQTVAINADMDANMFNPLHNEQRPRLSFKTTANTTSSEFDMDMTRSQTVAIDADNAYPHPVKNRKSLASVSPSNMTCSEFDMDLTRSQTVAIDAENVDPHPVKNRQSLAFVTPSNTTCGEFDMDLTRSQTVAINTDSADTSNEMLHSPDELDMSMTMCQTVGIKAERVYPHAIKDQRRLTFTVASQPAESALDDGRLKHMTQEMEASERTERDPDDMEFTGIVVTKHLEIEATEPAKIMNQLGNQGLGRVPSTPLELDMTKSRDAAGKSRYERTDEENLPPIFTSTTKERTQDGKMFDAVPPSYNDRRLRLSFKTAANATCSEFDMDLTRSQTVAINTDPDLTRNRAVAIPAEQDDMSMTVCQMVAIDSVRVHPRTLRNHRRLTFTASSQPGGDGDGLDGGSLKQTTQETEASRRMEDDSDDMELTGCVTERFGNHKGLGQGPSMPPELDVMRSRDVAVESTYERTANHVTDKTCSVDLPSVHPPRDKRSSQVQGVAMPTLDCTKSTPDGTTERDTVENISSPSVTEGIEAARTEFQLDAPPLEAACTRRETVTLPDASEEMHHRTDPEPASSARRGSDSSAASGPADAKTKRLSLVDLRSKLKRISLSLKNDDELRRQTLTDLNAAESTPLPVVELQFEAAQIDSSSDDREGEEQCERDPPEDGTAVAAPPEDGMVVTAPPEDGVTTLTAPLNLRSKSRLVSRLSMGCFTPKLPQRNKTQQTNQPTPSAGRQAMFQGSDMEHFGGIQDEVMPDWVPDDDTEEWQLPELLGAGEARQPLPGGRDLDRDLQEVATPAAVVPCENLTSLDHCDPRGEPRRPSVGSVQEMVPSPAESDCTRTAASGSIEYSGSSCSSTTSHGSEPSASESSFKPSLVESQLEDLTDWGNSLHKKLEDENMTVLQFFKCFAVDFAFYDHRQSVTPAKLASDVDCDPEDLLRLRHIIRPKAIVYENDFKRLADTMDGLRVGTRDKEQHVSLVNSSVWTALGEFSEKELQCFGAKLKEKSKFFRRKAKAQSHEMKEVLYSTLHRAYQEELQKLREKNMEADEMLKTLDDCIHDLQTSLDAVEGNDLNISGPTLRSRQRELEKVTMKLADGERQMSELKLHNQQVKEQVSGLRAETGQLQQRSNTLEMLNEWKLKEETEQHVFYTFMSNTLNLELEFEEDHGDLTDDNRKISKISMTLVQLDDKKSKCHTRLVHKLLSQYLEENPSLKDLSRCPTRLYVPQLLHRLSMSTSRLSLLGQELGLMSRWGAMRLNLLEISCEDNRVVLLFSSLKAFAKFHVSLEVTPEYPLCPVRLCCFTNRIGTTTRSQIEDLVDSADQGKNLLTRIVKRINDTLLR